MEWDIEDVFKVIELYKKYSCLWDRKSRHYKSNDLKNNIWVEISKEMNKSVDEVKRKIKNLRSAYLLEKKKVDESGKTALSPFDVHRPHLFYYEKMRFLDNIVILRKPTDMSSFTQDSFTENEISIKHIASEDSIGNNIDDVNTKNGPYSFNDENSQEEPASERSFQHEETSTHSNALKRIKMQIDHSQSYDLHKVNENVTIFSSFAKSVELQLSYLPLVAATKAMADVQLILSNYIEKIENSKYENSVGQKRK